MTFRGKGNLLLPRARARKSDTNQNYLNGEEHTICGPTGGHKTTKTATSNSHKFHATNELFKEITTFDYARTGADLVVCTTSVRTRVIWTGKLG